MNRNEIHRIHFSIFIVTCGIGNSFIHPLVFITPLHMNRSSLKRKHDGVASDRSDNEVKRRCVYGKVDPRSISIDREMFDDAIIECIKRQCDRKLARECKPKKADYELFKCFLHTFVKNKKYSIQRVFARIIDRSTRETYRINEQMKDLFLAHCEPYINREMWSTIEFKFTVTKMARQARLGRVYLDLDEIKSRYPGKFSIRIGAANIEGPLFYFEYIQRYDKTMLTPMRIMIKNITHNVECCVVRRKGNVLINPFQEDVMKPFMAAVVASLKLVYPGLSCDPLETCARDVLKTESFVDDDGNGTDSVAVISDSDDSDSDDWDSDSD